MVLSSCFSVTGTSTLAAGVSCFVVSCQMLLDSAGFLTATSSFAVTGSLMLALKSCTASFS